MKTLVVLVLLGIAAYIMIIALSCMLFGSMSEEEKKAYKND